MERLLICPLTNKGPPTIIAAYILGTADTMKYNSTEHYDGETAGAPV